MNCPLCKEKLQKALFYNVEVDYCPLCLGMFFDEDELRLAKDEKEADLRWVDIDLWQDKSRMKVSRKTEMKFCPKCRLPLYQVEYGQSGIEIDLCRLCKGIWLDRGEFKKIIDYLKEKAKWDLLHNLGKTIKEETWEVFIGPEGFREELADLLALIKLIANKFPKKEEAD